MEETLHVLRTCMHVSVHVGRIGMSGVMGGKGGNESDQAVAGTVHLTVMKTSVVGSMAP